MPPGTDPGLLRRINAVSIVQDLRRKGVMTLTSLSASTGLSRRTIESILDTLRADGLVEEVTDESGPRGAGRPARGFRFVAESGALVGVQIAAHEVFAIVTDLNGAVVGKAAQDVRSTTSRKGRLLALHTAIDRAVSSARVPRERLRVISAGTPGIVEPSGYISSCTALPEWSEFDLAAEITAAYSCDVRVNNDTNLSAIGERAQGTSAGFDNAVWLLTGRRTSMGMIIGGRLYRGDDGAAGEIGLLGGPWGDVREHPLSFFGATGRPEAAAAGAIIDGAQRGNPAAQKSVDQLAASIAQGLSGVVLSLNPGCVVLGGPLAQAGPILVSAVERHLQPLVLKVPEIRASGLGTEATAIGAVRAALDVIDDDLNALWLSATDGADRDTTGAAAAR
jgi:predicted NBD/HSP70 family sugar kinase